MRRMIAILAGATAAALIAPLPATAHASAQAPDPLTALKKKISSGHGVAFVDTIKMRHSGESTVLGKRDGELQFDATGVSASDHTTKLRFDRDDLDLLLSSLQSGTGDWTEREIEPKKTQEEEKLDRLLDGLADPERIVRVKNTAYMYGGVFGPFLPTGKPWLRIPEDSTGIAGAMGQYINPAEPTTLKALLANATVKRPTVYSGKITFGELHKVSPWFRAAAGKTLHGSLAKTTLNWKLYLGADRLPKRLTTWQGTSEASQTVDTSYSGWGSEVAIAAPPADQVATMKELADGIVADIPVPLVSIK
ncbi:hypothetical protein GCM10010517_56030 [Streptosporangium fragile]|uniref:Uncharacterized protein n=1 Tax=Streptosporangium fragile TaxID=46186 RepID=A0ABN3W6E4_9ACTN